MEGNYGIGISRNKINNYHDSTQVYNVNTNHPLIPSSQEYMFYKKYVSIHSEDRDQLKYPNSSEFEIELPEDYTNVASIKLIQWTFPANYTPFSAFNSNITMTFKITNPYNPIINGFVSPYYQAIFEALWTLRETNYLFEIEDGFYNPQQMATELTKKFNYAVTQKLRIYFQEKGMIDILNEFNTLGGYSRFIIVYNYVNMKMWFGNNADEFTLTNETAVVAAQRTSNYCVNELKRLPDFSNYGLPGYLGLPRCDVDSSNTVTQNDMANFEIYNGIYVPRFYYGDVIPGDNGYWLLPNPDFTGSVVNWVVPSYKINLMGDAFIYMELVGQNCIDETQPFNVSQFTMHTNQTNGVVNSAFAKIPVPTTPLSQWFDRDAVPYKYYYPPAERMRRLKMRFRYHNGQLVNFGPFNFSLTLEFNMQFPQMLRSSNSINYPPVVSQSTVNK